MRLARFIGLLLAALAVGLSGCGGDEDTRPELAFVSTRDGDYAIYRMDAEGRGEDRLTDHEVDTSSPAKLLFQLEPAWSPDGTKIAFSSRRAGTFDLYVMNADGSGTTRLTRTRDNDSRPTWSPTGRRLAFARDQDIYAMNADGSGVRRVSDPAAEETDPAWSPNGRWIAYVRRTPGTPARELWLMRPDGSDRRALTSRGARIASPAWSPDGSRIVFSANEEGEPFELFTVGVDGKNLRSVVGTVADNFEPSWSPDGSTIAYQEEGAIFTIELGGGEVKRLTDAENNDSSPVWNPSPPPES